MDSHNIAYLDVVYIPLCSLYTLHYYAAGTFTSSRMWKVYHSNMGNLQIWAQGVKVKLLISYQPVTKINIGWIHTMDEFIHPRWISRLRWVIYMYQPEMDLIV